MKRCPACSRVYDDDQMRFCLDDGTTLVNRTSAPAAPATLAFHENVPAPTIQTPPPQVPLIAEGPSLLADPLSEPRQRKLWPWLIGVGALIVLASGIWLSGWVSSSSRSLPWHLVLETRTDSVNQTVEVLKRRLDTFGARGAEVLPQGNGRILLNLPAGNDPERLKQFLTNQGKLELARVVSAPNPSVVQTYSTREDAAASMTSSEARSSSRRVVAYQEPGIGGRPAWIVIELPAIVSGAELRNATASQLMGDVYQIEFTLNQTGAERFGAWTAANIYQYLAIVLNDEAKSVASIKSQISDSGNITGNFTKQAAEDLALVLKSGALPAPVVLIEERVDKQ
jgi:preprotein translocase subunit SecD